MIHYIRPERINGAMTKLVLFFRIITENTKIDQLHVIFAHLCTSAGDQKPNYQLFFVDLLLSQFLRRRDSMASFLPDCNNNNNKNKDFGNLVFGH